MTHSSIKRNTALERLPWLVAVPCKRVVLTAHTLISITEIVYVSTVNHVHADQCIQLMNAGKHVLCEKPMTLNLKDTKRVLESAKKNGMFFMEVRLFYVKCQWLVTIRTHFRGMSLHHVSVFYKHKAFECLVV